MIDLHCGRGQLAPVVDAPREGVEASVNRACGAAALVKIDGTEANDGTESTLPRKTRQLRHDVFIGLKFQAIGAGRLLVLIDLQRAGEAHAVIAQPPTVAVAMGSSRKRPSTQHQQISAGAQVLEDRWPSLFRKRRTIGQYQQSRVRKLELRRKLLRRRDFGTRD